MESALFGSGFRGQGEVFLEDLGADSCRIEGLEGRLDLGFGQAGLVLDDLAAEGLHDLRVRLADVDYRIKHFSDEVQRHVASHALVDLRSHDVPVVLVLAADLSHGDDGLGEGLAVVPGEELGVADSNPLTGEYKISLPYGNRYAIRAEAKDFIPVSKNIDLTIQGSFKEIKDLDLSIAPIQTGVTVQLYNIFFKFFIQKSFYFLYYIL